MLLCGNMNTDNHHYTMDKEHLRTLIETYTLIAINASGAKDEERARKLARVTAIAVLAELEAEHVTNVTDTP